MRDSQTGSATWRRRRTLTAASAAVGLLLGSVVLATTASAAPLPTATPITNGNPLEGASGFTVLSFGDLELGNHEIEGSVAAGGDVSVSAGPFNIVHSAAGSSDYVLPSLAGTPIRLVTGGTFDVAASGTQRIQVTSAGAKIPAQEGRIRLGESASVSLSGRGAGVCVQAIGVADCSAPALEQSAFAQTVSSVTDPLAYSTLVTRADEDALTQWSAAIAGGRLVDTHQVTWPTDHSNPMNGIAVTLVADQVNVLDVAAADLPTGDWKLAFTGARPSATTTLVINIVGAGDGAVVNLPLETLDAYSAPGSSTNNAFARYMLWNIDQPAGHTVVLKGDGIIPGSVLAPRSIVVTGPGKTLIEGQVVGAQLRLRHSGEVHHYGFLGQLETSAVVRGGFSITKTVTGVGASVTSFTGTWTCTAANAMGLSAGTWTLAAGDATTVAGFPVGTTCVIAETAPTAETHGTWTSAIDRPSVIIVAGDGTAPADRVAVLNTFVPSTVPGVTPETPVIPVTPVTPVDPGTPGPSGTGGAGGATPGAPSGATAGAAGTPAVLPVTTAGAPTTSGATASASRADALAVTGSSAALLAGLALVLVAVGAGALGIQRARRRAQA